MRIDEQQQGRLVEEPSGNAAIACIQKDRRHRPAKRGLDGAEPAIFQASATDPRVEWLYQQIRQRNEVDSSLTLLLLVALYQQRERFRQRLLKQQFVPMYGVTLFILAVLGVVFVTFLFNRRFQRHGFPMSAWDYVGFAVAAGALLFVVAPMCGERERHERTQEILAPSLREDLDRGVGLDFEIGLHANLPVMRILTLLSIIPVIVNWEAGRPGGFAVRNN